MISLDPYPSDLEDLSSDDLAHLLDVLRLGLEKIARHYPPEERPNEVLAIMSACSDRLRAHSRFNRLKISQRFLIHEVPSDD